MFKRKKLNPPSSENIKDIEINVTDSNMADPITLGALALIALEYIGKGILSGIGTELFRRTYNAITNNRNRDAGNFLFTLISTITNIVEDAIRESELRRIAAGMGNLLMVLLAYIETNEENINRNKPLSSTQLVEAERLSRDVINQVKVQDDFTLLPTFCLIVGLRLSILSELKTLFDEGSLATIKREMDENLEIIQGYSRGWRGVGNIPLQTNIEDYEFDVYPGGSPGFIIKYRVDLDFVRNLFRPIGYGLSTINNLIDSRWPQGTQIINSYGKNVAVTTSLVNNEPFVRGDGTTVKPDAIRKSWNATYIVPALYTEIHNDIRQKAIAQIDQDGDWIHDKCMEKFGIPALPGNLRDQIKKLEERLASSSTRLAKSSLPNLSSIREGFHTQQQQFSGKTEIPKENINKATETDFSMK